MDCSIVFSHREESEEKAEMKTKWKTTFLRSVIQYISKGIAPSYTEIESDTTVRVLNQKCNRNFVIRYNESRLHDIAKKKVPAERYVQENDIIINSTGTGTAGRIAQMQKPPCRTTVDSHMIILRGNSEINQRYLGYALRAKQNYILQLDEGTTGQTELNRERLLDEIEITYPTSLKIQEAIASTLSVLDDKIELNRKINENLEQQAQAIFKNSFLIEIFPKDWTITTLGEVSEIIAGGDKPNIVAAIRSKSCPYPVYSNGISNEGLYGFTDGYRITEESVTVSARGTIGYVCLRHTPYTPIVRLVTLVPHTDVVSAKFLYLWLKNIQIQGTGTTQQQLTVPNFKKTKIVLPPKGNMLIFTEMIKPLFETIWANQAENAHLAYLRDTLLPRLMSGELDVPHLEGA